MPNSPEIASLRKKLEELQGHNPYPCSPRANRPRMQPILGYVEELAFFPVGPGWKGTAFPRKKIMVLGNNFGSERYIEKIRENRQGDTKAPTWKNLCELFKHANISEECCFFTNAYMGAISGEKNVGKTPGCHDTVYLKFCQRMFFYQLEVQRPRLIVALGKWVPPFLFKLDQENLKHWKSEYFTERDKALNGRGAVVNSASFRTDEAGSVSENMCVVASILHPSLRGPNLHRRSYAGCNEGDAEIGILRDALRLSGLQDTCG
jgi:hypothetical protein